MHPYVGREPGVRKNAQTTIGSRKNTCRKIPMLSLLQVQNKSKENISRKIHKNNGMEKTAKTNIIDIN